MIISRNGEAPQIDPEASVADSARIVGNVRIGPRAYVDHGVVIESSGPPVEIAAEAIVFAGAIILQGASIADHVRVGAGAIVHATTAIPEGERVGMRHLAVPTPQGFLSTADVEEARKIIGAIDFFETAFGGQGAIRQSCTRG